MKNILILGATGRIGKLLVQLFSEKENNITVYVRSMKKAAEFENVNIESLGVTN